MGTKKINRLTLSERVVIETLLGENRTQPYIAKKLNRARSTISREINTWKNSSTSYSGQIELKIRDWTLQDLPGVNRQHN